MTTEIIDRKAIERLLNVIGGNREDLVELVQEFHDTTPLLAEKMRTDAIEGNVEAIRISAHSLKSNARDFGAVDLAVLCEKLEHACRAGDLSDTIQQVEEIIRSLDIARDSLKSLNLPEA